jgi:hypothetical protein
MNIFLHPVRISEALMYVVYVTSEAEIVIKNSLY